ncbi:MAG: ABC transporter ATP-binding protein [Deltaproteobacteria bacterium]|nr:ABC transporter ATP-binding protein [Deltaproteobacteria bacterium]MBM4322206.1 ABC transporter ATP-binding protein [Deltaproteobacteria bacterium]
MILRFEGVTYHYPGIETPALDGLDLTIHSGESVLVAGTSGSGKSTFCRACIGLVPHFHHGKLTGKVLVDGLDTGKHPVHELFRHAGLVFQNPDAQLFNQTVEAEMVYGLESLGLESSEIEKRLAWASNLTELDSLMGRSPHTLSGGEKQRVALGAILTLRPRLLLLDEPFTHLDPEATEMLRKILRSLKSEGITIIIVEHRLHEIIQDVDRIIIFNRGRSIAEGPPHQVLSGDISGYGLNLPPLLRLLRDFGLKITVFDIEKAIEELKAQNLLTPFYQHLIKQSLNPFVPRTETTHPVVEIEALWSNYNGTPLLRGINLKLQKGESVALLGRNGAGKTTLIKYLNGLLKPQKGLVRIFGSDTRKKSVSELSRNVSLVWQNPNDQIFRPTVREEVLTGPKIFHSYDPLWCDGLFDRFGLLPFLDRSPFALSEGQKKRVSFAAALSVKPDLIVLDEPTAGQDEPYRRELTSYLHQLREEGQTVIFVTHDFEFAAEHADRWLILSDGKIIADGSPDGVMEEATAMSKAGLRPTQQFQLIQAIKRLEENKN